MSVTSKTISSVIKNKLLNTSSQSSRIYADFVFHFTNITNIKSILQSDKLLSRKNLDTLNTDYFDTASTEVINHTSKNILSYCRFYFGPRTPMLYKVEGYSSYNVDNNIAHCPVPIFLVFNMDMIFSIKDVEFTDGNAASYNTKRYNDIDDIVSLNLPLVYSRGPMKGNKDETKRCRQAEILVPNEVSLSSLNKIVCRSEAERDYLLYYVKKNTLNLSVPIEVDRNYYEDPERIYFERVNLLAGRLSFELNRGSANLLKIELTRESDKFSTATETRLEVSHREYNWEHNISGNYAVSVYLDEQLMYENLYISDELPF